MLTFNPGHKCVVWTKHVWCVFKIKAPSLNFPGVVWTPVRMDTCNYPYSLIECPVFYLRAKLNLWELRLHSKNVWKGGSPWQPIWQFLHGLSFVNMRDARKKEISKLTFISSISSPSTTPPANDSFSGYQDYKNTVKCSLFSCPQHGL